MGIYWFYTNGFCGYYQLSEVAMQARIDNFINDFYADVDGRTDSKPFVAEYFNESSALCHFGEIFRGAEAIEGWYDSLKAGFRDSVHQIKKTEYKQFGDVTAVRADVVWTAAFRNMDGNNRIMYKVVVNMDLTEDNGSLKIKNYKSVAV